MDINLKKEYPDYYKKIKNLGYDSIEIRKLESNLNLEAHFHPFTACMIILEGVVSLKDKNQNYTLKPGDFIEVGSNELHSEKTTKNGAVVIYGKKFEKENNLSVIEYNINNLIEEPNSIIKGYIKKNASTYILYLTIFKQYYSEKWLGQEEIFDFIPKRLASRSTIINIINDGINKGYIIKRIASIDKRSVFYELSLEVFKELEQIVNFKYEKN